MPIKLQPANLADVPGLVELRNSVNQNLASQFAGVIRAGVVSAKSISFAMSRSTVLVARYRGKPIATLALSTRKPWSIADSGALPEWMNGHVREIEGKGRRRKVCRRCIAQAIAYAQKWPATAIRLDAYDAQYGAGEFYRKCGFREVGRASYRNTPLIYFEMVLSPGD
jgi:GNAT superfamily N-acetyltransferase